MKKLVIVIVIVCSLGSCAKDDLLYSCNKEADSWIKNNLANVQDMTRVEWLAIGDLTLQNAAYVAFSPSQREALWIGKMEEVLTLDWSVPERKHIQTALDLMNTYSSYIFSNEPIPQHISDELEIINYKWETYAREELRWCSSLLYAILFTPQAMNYNKEIDTNFNPVRLKNRSESSTPPDCKCNVDKKVGCEKGEECRTRECRELVKLCGSIFARVSCDGMCVIVIPGAT